MIVYFSFLSLFFQFQDEIQKSQKRVLKKVDKMKENMKDMRRHMSRIEFMLDTLAKAQNININMEDAWMYVLASKWRPKLGPVLYNISEDVMHYAYACEWTAMCEISTRRTYTLSEDSDQPSRGLSWLTVLCLWPWASTKAPRELDDGTSWISHLFKVLSVRVYMSWGAFSHTVPLRVSFGMQSRWMGAKQKH